MQMDEMEMTRLMKELTKLLQNTSVSKEEAEDCFGLGLDERFEAIKRELGSWFIEGYRLYQAS
jgi:hypothetical protein